MHAMETLDATRDLIRALGDRPEPLVRELPAAAGTRAEKYVQLLCPNAHPLDTAVATSSTPTPTLERGGPSLNERVTALEAEVAALRGELKRLCAALGGEDAISAASRGS
jgi:uncharacterized protein YceH (UPF0502 family)